MEYALLIAGIAAAIVVIVFAFGTFVGSVFTETCDTVTAETGPVGYDCDG